MTIEEFGLRIEFKPDHERPWWVWGKSGVLLFCRLTKAEAEAAAQQYVRYCERHPD